MSGYIGVDEQVDKDFHRALLKASLRRWRNRLRRERVRERLLSFDEAKHALTGWSQSSCQPGIQTVEVEKITGSVGRCRDFDASFLPLRTSMVDRWGRVDRAYHRGVELPAVSLYKVGEAYFVRDGNHRVSVAKYHGVVAIDAEVVEIRGQTRTEPARSTTRAWGTPTRLPQPSPDPDASLLCDLRRRILPRLFRPRARVVA